jgi:hypothetical protein
LFSSLAVAGEGLVLQVQLSKFDAMQSMQSLLCCAPAVLTSERHQRTVPERATAALAFKSPKTAHCSAPDGKREIPGALFRCAFVHSTSLGLFGAAD